MLSSYSGSDMRTPFTVNAPQETRFPQPGVPECGFAPAIAEKARQGKRSAASKPSQSPGVPFRAKVCLGKETITLSGKLEPATRKDFRLEVRYRYTLLDTGWVLYDGSHLRSGHRLETTVEMNVGERLTISKSIETLDKSGQPSQEIKVRSVLHLDKYDPMKP